MTTDNKQSVLTDPEISTLFYSADTYTKPGCEAFARAIEQAVLSKLRGASEPAGVISVQECDVVPYVHPEFGAGIFFTEDCRIAAPQASASQDSEALQKAKHDSAHARTERERVTALSYWMDQQTFEPGMLSCAAATLRSYLDRCEAQASAEANTVEDLKKLFRQERDRADQARNAALEEAAAACKNTSMMNVDSYCGATASMCADHIRRLKSAPAPEGEDFPSDLPGQLREYASNNGYSHQDYADTMRQAADALDRQQRGGYAEISTPPRNVANERQAFEMWATDFMGLNITHNGSCGYVNSKTNGAWLAWGAETRHRKFIEAALASQKPAEGDAHKLMAEEYQAWIDCYHAGGDYTDFLAKRLSAIAQQGNGTSDA